VGLAGSEVSYVGSRYVCGSLGSYSIAGDVRLCIYVLEPRIASPEHEEREKRAQGTVNHSELLHSVAQLIPQQFHDATDHLFKLQGHQVSREEIVSLSKAATLYRSRNEHQQERTRIPRP
jgi:hypothetical protein